MADQRRIGRALLLRRPRATAALVAAIAGFGVLSSSVGVGALPVSTLPVYGVTAGDGSRATVAELGDINGDGIGDYAVGLPSATVGGIADTGVVDVFLGHAGALPPTPAPLDLAAASFRITGHGGEMLGFAVVGDDVNGDGLADVVIGAPMASPPVNGGGAVYVIFGSRHPQDVATTELYPNGAFTNDPASPAAPSPIGSRYDGFLQNSHTGISLAALPDVNGDGYGDLAVGSADADLHIPGGGGLAVLYGKPRGVHITLNDLWEGGYPYYFHADYPARNGAVDQHVGESVALVGDVTGDGWPDIAVGAPQADFNGRTDSGSVWIISGHLPPIDAGCSNHMVDNSCPWIRMYQMTAAQGYRIDGAQAGDGLGSSLAGVGDQNGDGIPDIAIGESAASPDGRAHAGAVVVVPGERGVSFRDLAVSPPLQEIDGAAPGAGLGASLAAAGDVDGDGRVDMLAGAPGEAALAGAAYVVRGAPGVVDLALAAGRIALGGAGAQTGSAVAAGSSLDGSGADFLIAAPGAGTAFIVGGGVAPAPVTAAIAAPATAPADRPAVHRKPALRLCPLVRAKGAKHRPKPCRPRPRIPARGGKATPVAR